MISVSFNPDVWQISLLTPTKGTAIAMIPQEALLFNGTIRSNLVSSDLGGLLA